MDNQQERLFDLGWISCAIESEGSISLVKSARNKKGYRYTPLISITNADDKYLDNCERILKKENIPYYIYKRKRGNCTDILIRGYQRVKNFMTNLKPYLRTKKKRADVLNKYIEYRLSVPQKQPYDSVDDSYYLQMKQLNSILRDYTLDTSVKI